MYAGFDSMSYPGDSFMRGVWANSNQRVVGYYVAHHPGGAVTEWTAARQRAPDRTTWRFLRDEGWTMLPTYVGRQIVAGTGAPPGTMNSASGTQDGQEAANLAVAAGIERGATLYLDLELSGWGADVNDNSNARAYIDAWFAAIEGRGYRKGLYLPHADLNKLGARYADAAMWFYKVGLRGPSPFDEGSQRLTPPSPAEWPTIGLGNGGTRQATAWQFDQLHGDNPATQADDARRLPDGRVLAGVAFNLGGRTQPVSPIDFDASLVPDPAHPESRGGLALSRPGPAGEPLAAFVEAPTSVSGVGQDAAGNWDAAAVELLSTPGELGAGSFFDARSVAAASRQPGFLDVFGIGLEGEVWTAWRNPAESFPAHPWTLNAATPARKESPIAAVSRKQDQLDVFFVNRDHELATNFWNPNDAQWNARPATPITIGTAVAPASNIAALADWSDPERLDVAFVGWDSAQVHWARWAGADWGFEAVPALPTASAAAGVAAARIGDSLHLVCVSTADGQVYHTTRGDMELGSPESWSAATVVGAALPRSIAARVVAVGSELVMVAINEERFLWWALFTGGVWLPAGFDVGTSYSTGGRLDAVAQGDTVSVLAFDAAGAAVVRRLRVNRFFGLVPAVVAEAAFSLAI